MKPINSLPPFKRFCVTIGNLPSSYVDSMSYYECIMWLCKYLKDTVIPAVNENAEAVNELINWFNNLDVQDEVNNKLDEMVESGELEEIIASYLNTNAILGFNTVSDMKTSTNLINGSYARTYGKTNIKDGKGSLYKVRTITSSDVVDNDNIVPLNVSETLIAERIRENNKEKRYIFIGDSYGTGQNELQEQTIPWTTLVPRYMGLSESQYFKDSSNGSGFKHGYTFKQQLIRVGEEISDKYSITDIIVVGGYNDQYNTVAENLTAIEEFCTYAKANYPNAQISITSVGWSKVYDVRQAIANRTLPAYTKCGKFGARYLKNCEYILHDYSLFSGDSYHPNQNGQNELSSYLVDAILNGECNVIRGFTYPTYEVVSTAGNYKPTYVIETQNNGTIELLVSDTFFAVPNPVSLSRNTEFPLMNFSDGLIYGAGLDLFKSNQGLACSNAGGSSVWNLPVYFTCRYDSTNNKCVFKMVVDKTNTTTGANVSNLLLGTVRISIPALYC